MAIGRLGKDSELKNLPSGNMVYENSLAVTKKFKDKTGQQKEKTEWVNIILWQKSAEIFSTYTKKGSQVYIEGELETQEYEKDGQKKYITKINVNNFQFLDAKGGAEKANGGSSFTADDIGF